MITVIEGYRDKAAQCLSRAYSTDDPKERADMLNMAMQWARLAEQAERSAERAASIDAMLPGERPPASEGEPEHHC